MDSEILKGVLEVISTFINAVADNKLLTLITEFGLAFSLIWSGGKLLEISKLIPNFTKDLAALGNVLKITNLTVSKTAAIIGVVVTAGSALISFFDEYFVSAKEQKEITEELTNELNSLNDEYDKLANKDNLTQAEEKRLELLNKQIEAYEILAEKSREASVLKEFEETYGEEEGIQKVIDNYNDLIAQRKRAETIMMGGELDIGGGKTYTLQGLDPERDAKSIQVYRESLRDLDGQIAEVGKEMQAWGSFLEENKEILEESGVDVDSLSETYQNFLDDLVESSETAEDSVSGIAKAIEEIGSSAPLDFSILSEFSEQSSKLEELEKNWDNLTKIVDEYNSTGYMTVDNFKTLTSLSSEYTGLLSVENGVLKLNSEYFYNASEQAKTNAKQMVANSLATEVLTIAGISLEDT